MNFKDRKAARKEFYEKKIFRKRLVICTACSGSGYYDGLSVRGENIQCESCNGVGKVREV